MRYALLLALIACAAPTDNPRLEAPASVDELRIVHPRVVTVTVTPSDTTYFPTKWEIPDSIIASRTAQYVATARDGQGRVLTPTSWSWVSLDTTIAVVSQTGLVTTRRATARRDTAYVIIRAIAYSPWRR